jgi:hypothetical protein
LDHVLAKKAYGVLTSFFVNSKMYQDKDTMIYHISEICHYAGPDLLESNFYTPPRDSLSCEVCRGWLAHPSHITLSILHRLVMLESYSLSWQGILLRQRLYQDPFEAYPVRSSIPHGFWPALFEATTPLRDVLHTQALEASKNLDTQELFNLLKLSLFSSENLPPLPLSFFDINGGIKDNYDLSELSSLNKTSHSTSDSEEDVENTKDNEMVDVLVSSQYLEVLCGGTIAQAVLGLLSLHTKLTEYSFTAKIPLWSLEVFSKTLGVNLAPIAAHDDADVLLWASRLFEARPAKTLESALSAARRLHSASRR